MSRPFQKLADELQRSMRPLMEERGFREEGRTFHRPTGDGLTQLADLQMGTKHLHGSVTVNLGVFIPEVADLYGDTPENSIREYHCSIRARLGQLTPAGQDTWWELSSRQKTLHEVVQALRAYGLPWLDGLRSRDDILSSMESLEDTPWLPATPPRIVSAIILAERGRSEDARALLLAQANETAYPRHAERVRLLARELGLGGLG